MTGRVREQTRFYKGVLQGSIAGLTAQRIHQRRLILPLRSLDLGQRILRRQLHPLRLQHIKKRRLPGLPGPLNLRGSRTGLTGRTRQEGLTFGITLRGSQG